MADVETNDIADALLTRAGSLIVPGPPGVTALPVAMPEVSPPWGSGAPPAQYLRVSMFDNRPRWVSLDGKRKMAQGILQIEVVWKRGVGVIAPRKAAQKVIEHFPTGLTLNAGSARVTISPTPWHGSPMSLESSLVVVVSIPWSAVKA